MKNTVKFLGIIAMVAVIGFSMAACGDDPGGDNTPSIASFAGTWEAGGRQAIVFWEDNFIYKDYNTTPYSGTFSVSGSTITFDEIDLGAAKGNFSLSGNNLVLSNHTWDSNVNGTYFKSAGIPVTLNSVNANGNSSTTTTQLTLVFSQAIVGLSAEDIILSGVSGVTKGTLGGTGPTYTLPIGGFTAGGALNVAVVKSGYVMKDSPKTVTIYYYSGSGGGTVLDGTWSRNSGAIAIAISGNNWVYSEDGHEYSKGTWSSTNTPTAGSSGTITLIATHVNMGSGWTDFPAQYNSVKTNTATFTINAAGNQLVISNAQYTTSGVWGTLEGTYTKESGGGTAPNAPTDINAVAVSSSSITVSWNSVSSATSYTIYRSLSSGGTYTQVGTSATLSYTNTGLSAATTYYYKVSASNSYGSSSQSSSYAYATTLSGGGSGTTFNSISAFAAWLAAQPANTTTTAYSVTLNLSDLGGSSTISGSLGQVLRDNNNKYVSIDLSGSTITGIEESAFANCSTLTGIILPSTVTSIRDYVFIGCNSLRSVTFKSTITTGNFSNNYSFPGDLRSKYLAGGTGVYTTTDGSVWTKTGEDPSYTNLPAAYFQAVGSPAIAYRIVDGYGTIPAQVYIPSTYNGLPVTGIGDNAFSYKTNITSVTISNGVTTISGSAFNGCTNLASITIPASVTSISNGALAGCTSLSNIIVESTNPNYTSEGAILYNKEKTVLVAYPSASGTVTISNSVTRIERDAFENCVNLISITMPNSVTIIDWSAFWNCSRLNSVTIGNNVTSIGQNAFYGCTSLTSITIPSSVTSIGRNPFNNCSSLNTINVETANTAYSSDNGVLYNKNKTTLVVYPAGKTASSFSIPTGVTSIEYGAFYTCKNLSSVILPNSVISIGNDAFEYCTGLTSITIPASVTSIGYQAFSGCTSLASVTFQGIIASASFGSPYPFMGDLVTKYLAGGMGTYTTTTPDSYSSVWTKQGVYWTAVTTSSFGTSDINGITWGTNGNTVNRFVAVGESGKMAYSSDGTTWTQVTTSAFDTSSINGVTSRNGRFVAVGADGKMALSTNGMLWTPIEESTFGTSSINGITNGNGTFVAVGANGKMAYSGDGLEWTATDSNFGADNILSITYGNNTFVAVGANGKMAYSSDGITWAAVGSSTFGSNTINGITWGSGKFVAVGAGGKMASSTDGTTWATVTSTFSDSNIRGIAWGNDKFVAVGGAGKAAYSTDGTTWTAVADNITFSTNSINGIAWGNNKFVAVGAEGKMAAWNGITGN